MGETKTSKPKPAGTRKSARKPRKRSKASAGPRTRKKSTKIRKKSKKRAQPATKAAKKSTAKKSTAKKSTAQKTRGRRGPQGRRLGAWEIVGRDEVFAHLERTGTTIATLARTLGIGQSAVHAWKSGRRIPSEQAQLKLKQFLLGKLQASSRSAGRSGPDAETFQGRELRTVRERRGLSRAQLSKRLGVSAGSIRNWEAGVSTPRGSNLKKVHEFVAAAEPSTPPTVRRSGSQRVKASDSAVVGAAQVAAAYVATGQPMAPAALVKFVSDLRLALS